jgi:plastocyanin
MRCRLLISIASFSTIVAGCGGDGGYSSGPNNSNPSTSTTVTVQNNVFNPSATTVGVGATVNWTWAQGAADHNVTFDDGQKSATQSTGGYTRLFGTAGSYPYHCTLHPGMTGSVTVR